MDSPKISRISLTFAKGMIYDLTPKQPATCLEGNTASKYPPANSPEGGGEHLDRHQSHLPGQGNTPNEVRFGPRFSAWLVQEPVAPKVLPVVDESHHQW